MNVYLLQGDSSCCSAIILISLRTSFTFILSDHYFLSFSLSLTSNLSSSHLILSGQLISLLVSLRTRRNVFPRLPPSHLRGLHTCLAISCPFLRRNEHSMLLLSQRFCVCSRSQPHLPKVMVPGVLSLLPRNFPRLYLTVAVSMEISLFLPS